MDYSGLTNSIKKLNELIDKLSDIHLSIGSDLLLDDANSISTLEKYLEVRIKHLREYVTTLEEELGVLKKNYTGWNER